MGLLGIRRKLEIEMFIQLDLRGVDIDVLVC
jgi:hypothetical protein